MPWMVIVHMIFILTWSAGSLGLLYLLAAHKAETDPGEAEFLRSLERKLFFRVSTPAAVLAVLSGLWLMIGHGFEGAWMLVKLALVSLLVLSHVYSGRLLRGYWRGKKRHGKAFYHTYNGLQTLLITSIIYLVVSKSF